MNAPSQRKSRNKFSAIMDLIRIRHILFSLPMAYLGSFVVARGIPPLRVILLVFVALFFLRTAGMVNDDLIDVKIDAANVRTLGRPLVTGEVSRGEARALIVIGVLGFLTAAYFLNIWTFIFAPFVVLLVIGYPYMKKRTSLTSYHIAGIEAISVSGGAVAMSGLIGRTFLGVVILVPWLFVIATVFWAVGFDLYNSLPDMSFDRQMGLHSIAVALGNRTLRFAGYNQGGSVVLSFLADFSYNLGPISYIATIGHGILMAYAYRLASRGDFKGAFNYNIYSSIFLGIGVIIDVILRFPML